MVKKALVVALATALSLCASAGEGIVLEIDPQAIVEILPLATEAIAIQQRAAEREAKHAAELRAKGIAEVPPCGSERYVIDTPAFGGFSFDDWGELYIDRRFVTDEEMKTVKKIEAWIAKWFPKQTKKRTEKPRKTAGGAGLPVFRGFEDARYQEHDALIAKLVREFNADKKGWTGGTEAQAAKVGDLTPALVKAHMIEESGGNGPRSKAAWAVDPLQVNVPGDWGVEKELVGPAAGERSRRLGRREGARRARQALETQRGNGRAKRPRRDKVPLAQGLRCLGKARRDAAFRFLRRMARRASPLQRKARPYRHRSVLQRRVRRQDSEAREGPRRLRADRDKAC